MTDATETARRISRIPGINKKTVLASWMGAMDVQEGQKVLELNNIPVYSNPKRR